MKTYTLMDLWSFFCVIFRCIKALFPKRTNLKTRCRVRKSTFLWGLYTSECEITEHFE